MTSLRLLELAAWCIGSSLLLWLLVDAWRVDRSYHEQLLLSSREGEIEQDLVEVEQDLPAIEEAIDHLNDKSLR